MQLHGLASLLLVPDRHHVRLHAQLPLVRQVVPRRNARNSRDAKRLGRANDVYLVRRGINER